jgi:hypothetical protein
MTSATNGTKPPAKGASAVIAISAVLALGLGGLGVYLRHGALKSEGDLTRSKDEYERMVRMKRQIEELKKNAPKLPSSDKGGEDLLQLLASKARQANIPQNMLTTARNPDRKEGGWKEVTYTVTLRAVSKENLVLRTAVADFLALVEKERPSVKAKNLGLTFSGNDFTSVTITFSLFQRESS